MKKQRAREMRGAVETVVQACREIEAEAVDGEAMKINTGWVLAHLETLVDPEARAREVATWKDEVDFRLGAQADRLSALENDVVLMLSARQAPRTAAQRDCIGVEEPKGSWVTPAFVLTCAVFGFIVWMVNLAWWLS